jgi:hypothetical protein
MFSNHIPMLPEALGTLVPEPSETGHQLAQFFCSPLCRHPDLTPLVMLSHLSSPCPLPTGVCWDLRS